MSKSCWTNCFVTWWGTWIPNIMMRCISCGFTPWLLVASMIWTTWGLKIWSIFIEASICTWMICATISIGILISRLSWFLSQYSISYRLTTVPDIMMRCIVITYTPWLFIASKIRTIRFLKIRSFFIKTSTLCWSISPTFSKWILIWRISTNLMKSLVRCCKVLWFTKIMMLMMMFLGQLNCFSFQ